MDSKFQTSFIPKRSFEEGGKIKNKTPISILFVTASIVTFIAVLGAAGIFAYQLVLNRELSTKSDQLEAKERLVDYDGIKNVATVDSKLKSATQLLNNHTQISNLFSLLERNTLKNLRFTSFTFVTLPNNKVEISMGGIAKTFGVVSKQEDLFANVAEIKDNFANPVFSNLSLDTSGNVNFNFQTTIDASLFDYKVATSTAALPVTQTVAATTSVATSSSATTTKTLTP